MATVIKKSIKAPDEVREFPNGSGALRVMKLDDEDVGYGSFKPGWRWSKDMKAMAGTETCQADHHLYVLSGRMAVKMTGGGESEVGPGETAHIPPGHDAWVVGNEPCVVVDWTGARTYAKR
ncbi:MAG TPA: cupin domain-containing protein [Polyangia bacterium]|jgi:mannose-6-phosphate isomerase-like protein (cupin superfamily)